MFILKYQAFKKYYSSFSQFCLIMVEVHFMRIFHSTPSVVDVIYR